MPKPNPEAVLAPILSRWQAIIPELAFEIEDDGDYAVVVVRILGEQPGRAYIRREFLDFSIEVIEAHVNRLVGAAISGGV